MKKTILFAPVALLVFASCKKDALQQDNTAPVQPQATVVNFPEIGIGGGGMIGDFLKSKLVAWYAFDHSTIDSANTSSYLLASSPVYVADRKGKLNSAVSFTGQYNIMTPYIALGSAMSISVWMKRDSMYTDVPFITPLKSGPSFWQTGYCFATGINVSKDGRIKTGGYVDEKWHHLVTTCDGSTMKFYVDGVLKGATSYNATMGTQQYQLGIAFFPQNNHWKGRLDDLRFYNRVLSQYDVTALYNL